MLLEEAHPLLARHEVGEVTDLEQEVGTPDDLAYLLAVAVAYFD